MNLFEVIRPEEKAVPVIISVPHSGIAFPKDLRGLYKKRMRRQLDDTDWFVHELYGFATEVGITMIKANLSRWVIDLNRDPQSVPLYNDGRLITRLTPTTDFFGNKIYKSSENEPNQDEIEKRLTDYYWPYYRQIESMIQEMKKKFGRVLLWDAHSIRHLVSTIQETPFPDMILGNNDEKTADPKLIQIALNGLRSGPFGVNHNTPFKGGHITRYFGDPANEVHALQLEMNKILYMDDNEINYNQKRAGQVQEVLHNMFEGLITTLDSL